MKNAEKYITNAFESIRQQDYNNCEVLIINDHSEDASLEKVRELQKENAEINTKIFNVEDGKWGPGAGRNIGLDHATGEYIVYSKTQLLGYNCMEEQEKSKFLK